MNFIVAPFIPFIFLTLSNDSVSIILTTSFPSSLFRDGPLEKLWGGGGGEFSSCKNFLSLSNSLHEFYLSHCMNIF